MIVLADTSVWVEHLRRGTAGFAALLESGHVSVHPFIIGELALGTLSPRAEILGHLAALPRARAAEHDEVLALVARERLWQRGIGWVDAHLLASARLERLRLWSLDRRLADTADRLDVGWRG